jgi:hypothetical protein
LPLAAKGEFALVSEKITAALSKPGQPVKRGTMAHDHHMHMLLAESAVHLREAAAIRQHAAQLEALAARDGHRLYQAIAHRAWGVAHTLAAEYAEAEVRLESALALFRSLDTRWQIGRTLVAWADLALARTDAAAAAGPLYQEALQVFESLGAATDAGRTRAALAALD